MKLTCIIILFLACSFLADAQNEMTLKEAISLGYQNNLEVNEAGLQMQTEEIRLKQSKAMRLPNLNAGLNYGVNHGRSIDPFTNSFINQNVTFSNYGANSNILLFNGGSLQSTIKENKTGFEASKMEWQQAKDNVTINIILAYLQILSAEEVLEQSLQQEIVTKKQIERLAILNKEGAISPSEYFDVKGQAGNDQISIADNKAAVVNAKLALSQLLNISYEMGLEVEKLPVEEFKMAYPQTPEAIYEIALQNFAQIKAANLRTLSAEKAIKAAKGGLFPSLYLGGNINTNYSSAASRSTFLNKTEVPSGDFVEFGGNKIPVIVQQNNYKTSNIDYGNQLSNNLFNTLNLSLSIPIFNASQVKNKISGAKINYKRFLIVEDHTKLQLRQSIEKSFLSLTNSLEKYKLLTEQVAAYAESFRGAEIRFNAGDISSVDYLIAKNNLDRSKINLIVSRYNFILRGKILDYYSGIK